MPTMLEPLDVVEQLRFDLVDKPDPPLNYIAALDALIHHARGTDPTLAPFECRYAIAARGARAAAPIRHYEEGGVVVSECFDFKHYNSGDADSVEVAAAGYTNADETPVTGLYDFLAATFHLIQQTGGTLRYRDRAVGASHMGQTGGAGFSPIDDNSTLEVDGVLMSLNDIMEGKK